MWYHQQLTKRAVATKIRRQQIVLAGNRTLKIYGTLTCCSGKRMQPASRVFFHSEAEALEMGYRPCGHCMVEKYREWIYSTHRK
ncbi:MAG: metal-binding protein [Cyclobacteriaceae bacterium]|nr:metal-binding protein [Cyclobacteriaceae bacterium]